MYFYIEPEVSGGLGDNTVMDTSTHPPIVSRLNYQFDGWLGDDLLEAFPCLIISKQLKVLLNGSGFSGYQLDSVEVSKSSQFDELYPGKQLPEFYWLKITGTPGKDDFGLAKDYRLVVSERVLDVLRKVSIARADIEDF